MTDSFTDQQIKNIEQALRDDKRGAIYNEEKYRQAKMLDNSSWQCGDRVLPRLITPSDVDIFWDNNGRVVLGELSSQFSEWRNLNFGQRNGFWSIIRGNKHVAVLCRHNGPMYNGKYLDTRYDVVTFQVMIADEAGNQQFTNVITGNDQWQAFVFAWYEVDGPQKLRERILRSIKPPAPIPSPRDDEFVSMENFT